MTAPNMPDDVRQAVEAIKREMGVDTAPAEEIAAKLPDGMRGRFWAAIVDQHLAERDEQADNATVGGGVA